MGRTGKEKVQASTKVVGSPVTTRSEVRVLSGEPLLLTLCVIINCRGFFVVTQPEEAVVE